jgi:hypothetical protein
MQFLSSEGLPLMGIKDFGEWKFYAVTRLRSILALTVMSSLKTKSPIPEWARRKFETAWNLNERNDPLANGPECLSGCCSRLNSA